MKVKIELLADISDLNQYQTIEDSSNIYDLLRGMLYNVLDSRMIYIGKRVNNWSKEEKEAFDEITQQASFLAVRLLETAKITYISDTT